MKKRKKKNKIFILLSVMALAACVYGCGANAKDTVSQVKEVLTDTRAGEAVSKIRKVLAEDGKPDPVESISEDKYAYSHLDEETRKVYDEIVFAIKNREEDRELSTTDVSVMERAYLAVRSDYCGFFWLDKFSYVTYRRGDRVIGIHITPSYTVTKEKQAALQKEIDAEAARMLEGIPEEAGDYEKALHVFEELIRNVDYVEDAPDNQNIVSVFVNHKTICQGYAYATQYLLEKAGIPCMTVVGTAQGENHAWNLALLDGEYYYIDTTWGNSQYFDHTGKKKAKASGSKYIDYDYFAATTETILLTHTPDAGLELPVCTATADNYYIREGKYFDTWEPEAVGELIRREYENGADQLQIKFSDMELYEQAFQYFVEDYHISDYCPGLRSIKFVENADNCVLFLQFPEQTGY